MLKSLFGWLFEDGRPEVIESEGDLFASSPGEPESGFARMIVCPKCGCAAATFHSTAEGVTCTDCREVAK